MILNYRNQPYPGFGTFSTYSFSIDNFFENLSGGLGFNVVHDNQGGLLSTTIAGITYSYQGRISRDWHINFGIQASYMNHRLNWNELTFPDQHNPFNTSTAISNESPPYSTNSHSANFAAGFVFYNRNLFAGASVNNITQPAFEFLTDQKLQRKYTLHFGYDFVLYRGRTRHLSSDDINISPNMIVQSQGEFNYINYGLYATILPIKTGVWFRHNLKHQNSLIFMLGLKLEDLTIGYSYDHSLSGFTRIGGGAHEISVLLNFNCSERNMKYRILNCPTF